jgi:hypothetical protein
MNNDYVSIVHRCFKLSSDGRRWHYFSSVATKFTDHWHQYHPLLLRYMIIIAADQNRQAATLNLGYLGYSPSSEWRHFFKHNVLAGRDRPRHESRRRLTCAFTGARSAAAATLPSSSSNTSPPRRGCAMVDPFVQFWDFLSESLLPASSSFARLIGASLVSAGRQGWIGYFSCHGS